MKILWLFPPSPKKGLPNISQYRFFKYMPIKASIIYPYLAASACTVLREAGHEVDFLDCPTEGIRWLDVDKHIAEADIVVQEARTPLIESTWEVCGIVKKVNPKAKNVLYGDHAAAFPRESLARGADFVLRGGDFDEEILYLVKQLNRFGTCNDEIKLELEDNLDKIPFVDREFVNWRHYYETWRHRDNFFWTMSGRGCSYHCIYCTWVQLFWENRVRLRSFSNVADEYEMLHRKYGNIEVLDDIDLFKTDWGVTFSKELIRRGLGDDKILWANQTHPNEIYGDENFKTMRKAGLITVKLGLESMNQQTLNNIKKGLNVNQVAKAFKILKDNHIFIHGNLMVGFPWETKADAENTIRLIKKLDPNQAQFSLIIPYPWTELYNQAKENGWLLVPESEWSLYDARRPMLKMVDMAPSEIADLYKNCWSSFYLNKKYMLRKLYHALHNPRELRQLYRGYKSVKQGHMRSMEVEN